MLFFEKKHAFTEIRKEIGFCWATFDLLVCLRLLFEFTVFMKKYYINSGEQNLGSFDFNDLKSRGSGRDMQDWFFDSNRRSKIRNISELKELFRTNWEKRKEGFRKSIDDETASFFKDRLLLFVALGLILGFGILFYSFYITSSISKDEQRSHNELRLSKESFWKERSSDKTEMYANTSLEEEEGVLTTDENGVAAKRMAQIEIELDMAKENLEAAKQELVGAKSFQFLRMTENKKEEIEEANKKIQVWKEEIRALEVEMENLVKITSLADIIE